MTQVKICGLKTKDTLDAAIEAGADYVGFVFFPKSPRNLEVDEAVALAKHAAGRARSVALVVDAQDVQLEQITSQFAPDVLQLHGRETPARVSEIKQRFKCEVWKAAPVATATDVTNAQAYTDAAGLILYDAKPPEDPTALPGGNGLSFDWRILDGKPARPFALAGGLTPENVADAVKLVDPDIVDVSSGVETAPGIKDAQLIERFIRAAKTAKQS